MDTYVEMVRTDRPPSATWPDEPEGLKSARGISLCYVKKVADVAMGQEACRICLDDKGSLIDAPCDCVARVHIACLERWRCVRKSGVCEVCHVPDFPTRSRNVPRVDMTIVVMRSTVCYPLHVYVEANLQDCR